MNHLEIEELGRAGNYQELKRSLDAAGYSEAAICARLGLRRLADFEMEASRRPPLPPLSCPTDVLIQLFLCGEFVDDAVLETWLERTAIALLESMGLLKATHEGRRYGTVALYPVGGLLIASDRWSWPDGSEFVAPPDTVYPALVRNTRLFLDLLPGTPCERCLDLGSGTGIAAFAAHRNGAKHAWASDIAERSTRFAEFNRRLNGLSGVSAVSGDLYAGVEGLTFDRIVAHPPYMPVLASKWVFLSGGEDGEQITRRLVEGLPRHLEEGGLCCCLTMGSDRKDSDGRDRPFESRVRDWLGERQGEFDIAFVVRKLVEPHQFAVSAGPFEPRTRADAHAWRDLFARLGVVSLAYGLLLIQRRRNRAAHAFTVRRTASPGFARADWQWLIEWESVAASERRAAVILDSPLYASRRAAFEVVHRLTEEGWTPQAYQLNIDRPFDVSCKADAWIAQLMAECDGRRTGRQLLQHFKDAEWIPAGTAEDEFADAIAPLVSGGLIEVAGLRPPRAEG